MQRNVWLALTYTVPINPSKARVYVWRKLKEFGAEYLKQSVAVLPNTAQNMQQFSALTQKIRQMGGEASIVELRFVDPADEAEMTARFKKQIRDEYAQLMADCSCAMRELRECLPGKSVSQKENERIKQMIKRYRKAKARDYFMEPSSGELEQGINEIIDTMKELAADVGKQLKTLMDN